MMSPGATMERVYLALKAMIVSGDFAPGTRLEPAQLANILDASPTPVRDALHRLSGEHLVESWHQEGFRQPWLAEGDLHALYGWAAVLMRLALKDRKPGPLGADGLIILAAHADYPGAIDSLFRAIAKGCENRELRQAAINMIDRSRIFREAELRIDSGSRVAVAAMEEDYRFGRWTALRSKITSFHRRRMAATGRVVAELRMRAEPLR